MGNIFDYEISDTERLIFCILGVVIVLSTLGLGFILWYDYFFEHRDYILRRRLYHFIKNGIKQPDEIDGYLVYAVWKYDNIWLYYWSNNGDVSIHSNINCILSNFAGGLFAKYTRSKIRKILHNSYNEAKNGYK